MAVTTDEEKTPKPNVKGSEGSLGPAAFAALGQEHEVLLEKLKFQMSWLQTPKSLEPDSS